VRDEYLGKRRVGLDQANNRGLLNFHDAGFYHSGHRRDARRLSSQARFPEKIVGS
jgi:hypothetical protein